jgi:hypothetical protein
MTGSRGTSSRGRATTVKWRVKSPYCLEHDEWKLSKAGDPSLYTLYFQKRLLWVGPSSREAIQWMQSQSCQTADEWLALSTTWSKAMESMPEPPLHLAAAELRVKQAREVAFLGAEGTQAERAAQANLDPTVTEANKGLEEAIYRKEVLKAKRATAQVLIDVWRSLNANQRATA